MASAVQVTDPITYHGEGAVWDRRVGRLLFVDMLAGDVMVWDPSGEIRRHAVGKVAAVVRPRKRGGYVLALEDGFAFTGDDFAAIDRLPPVLASDALRMNEGGCDPQGRFYCGSMAYAMTAHAASLYRLDLDLSVHTVLTGVTISNGLQWSRDGASVYYNDTATGRIDVFDFDPQGGVLSRRRPFVELDPARGAPDGLAIDEDGGLWVALWGGSAVHRYEPNGSLSEVIELPVPKVTSCAFGGADGRTLYITTSQEGLEPEAYPAAGALFCAPVSVSGAAVQEFCA